MPTIESGTGVSLRYLEESTQGTTPSVTPGDFTVLRCNSRNVNLTKNILESDEVRADRQKSDVRHGFNQVVGNPVFELSRAAHDDMLLWAFSDSAWNAVTTSGSPNLASTQTGAIFTRDAGSFLTDGFRPGDLITVTGFSNSASNVVAARVLTVTATQITVDATIGADEASSSGRDIVMVGNRIDVGTTLTTFTLERAFAGLTQYQPFRGVAINQLDVSIQPESIVTGTLGLIGMSAGALSGTPLDSAPTAAATNSPFSAFDGALYEGAASIAVVTGLDFSIDNGRSLAAVVGAATSPCVFEGTAVVTGTLTAFFSSAALLNKFINETESSLWIKLDDVDGTNFMNFVFPRVKYNGGDIDPPQEGGVVVSLPFQALVDSVTGTSVSCQRSNS